MRIITESQRCVCVCGGGGYSDIGVGLANILALEFRYLLMGYDDSKSTK